MTNHRLINYSLSVIVALKTTVMLVALVIAYLRVGILN